ncbi:MAG TPA: vitamin K epoxide reductase family protein [Patescibacteria group bacterium]|nr:vitamin K epoxide reductase family protein [Patescibacteria group bacterium]
MKMKLYFAIKALSLVGIILAIYLLWQQIFQPTFQPCNINATINCEAIISGAVAKTLGIPTPLYGLIGYLIIFFAAIFHKKRLLLGMASFGLAFCFYIAYVELVILKVICPICITCQLVMLSIFTLSVIINKLKSNT